MAICGYFKLIWLSSVQIILIMLILLFLIRVMQLASQHKVASMTHRSTINWIFTMLSLIMGYWIDSGMYSAIIMIIIYVIIDKSRLIYKVTIKCWKTYRTLNYPGIKIRSSPPQKKKSAYIVHPDFSADKLETNCANFASKYNIYIYHTISRLWKFLDISKWRSLLLFTKCDWMTPDMLFFPNQQMCQYLLKPICFQVYVNRLDCCLFECWWMNISYIVIIQTKPFQFHVSTKYFRVCWKSSVFR
jgi:hypothetical protein